MVAAEKVNWGMSMKKIVVFAYLVFLLSGCASSPEVTPSNENSYQRIVNAKLMECEFTRGVSFDFNDDIILKDPESLELPWKITIDKQSEEVTIYEQSSSGPIETYEGYEWRKWDGGISVIGISIGGGYYLAHIAVFDSNDTRSNNYDSYISGVFSDPDTEVAWNVSGECRVIE
jgi:hypothetical protein